MSYKDWYCVQVASNCEKKAKADLLARRALLNDVAILDVEVPERTELTFDKKGKRKAVKTKVLPGYILVQVAKRTVEHEDGSTERVFPPETRDTIMATFNVIGFAGADKKVPRMLRPREVKHMFDMVDETHLEVKQTAQVDYNIGDILDVIGGQIFWHDAQLVADYSAFELRFVSSVICQIPLVHLGFPDDRRREHLLTPCV